VAGFSFIAGMRVFDHQAPRVITSERRRVSTVQDRPRFDVTPKTTERNRIVRTNKSEAAVTNNKQLRSRYCIIKATKHTDRPEASSGLFATAELLVLYCVNLAFGCQSPINVMFYLSWTRIRY